MPPVTLSVLSLLAAIVGKAPAEPPSTTQPATSPTTSPATPQPPKASTRQPVVLELFTSEGCSSCPSGDELLGQLAAASTEQRPVIALAFHVDYWDRLGWKDTYASSTFTDRQRRYATVMGADGLYTPQLVVGGTADAVGSDAGKVKTLIDRATKAEPAHTSIEVSIVEPKSEAGQSNSGQPRPASNAILPIHAAIKDLPAGSVVNFALTQSEITSKIERGENAGRTLKHTHVVRTFKSVTPAKDGSADTELSLPTGVERSDLRVVAYVQDAKTMTIVAAREISVPPATPPSTTQPQAKKP